MTIHSSVKKYGIILGVALVIAAMVFAKKAGFNSQVHVASPSPVASTLPAGPMTVEGTMVCLPHKNTEGPQTLECAFGLKDTQGRYFGLSDTDPTYKNVSGVPMNVTVEVEGTFRPLTTESNYQNIGTIEVTKIKML